MHERYPTASAIVVTVMVRLCSSQTRGAAKFSRKSRIQVAERAIRSRHPRPRVRPRVYTRCGDVFKDTDVVSISELRAAREAAVVRDDDEEGEEPRR